MSRLKLKRFRVKKPSDKSLKKYLQHYTGWQQYHEIDNLPEQTADYLFDNDHPLVIDIGCGRGEFIINRAQENPNLNFIGIDVHMKSLWDCVNKASEQKIENIRFIASDMRRISSKFADQTAEAIYLLFPPPRTEHREMKKDILTDDLIKDIHRILQPDGEFVFVTDNPEYFEMKREAVNQSGLYEEAEISQGFEGGITRFQKFWESFEIPSSRIRYVKKDT